MPLNMYVSPWHAPLKTHLGMGGEVDTGKTCNRPRKRPLPGTSVLSYPASIPFYRVEYGRFVEPISRKTVYHINNNLVVEPISRKTVYRLQQ